MGSRFDCVLDICNRFEIWDNKRCLPVLRHGRLLSYATRRSAERVANLLNLAAGPYRRRNRSVSNRPIRRDGNAKSTLSVARMAKFRSLDRGDKQ